MGTPYGYIYLIRNKVNGKVYIGQTIRTVEQRWKQHLRDSPLKGGHFPAAIRKYGSESFDVVTLHQAFSREELDEMEKRAIWTHDSMNPAVGYNMTAGGEENKGASDDLRLKLSLAHMGHKRSEESRRKQSASNMGRVSAMKGRKQSPEAIQKMRESLKGKNTWMKGRKLSEETRAKIRAKNSGENHPNYGKKFSEETLRKMSEAKRGKVRGPHSEETLAKMVEAQRKRIENGRLARLAA